ncbi:MAG: hypothetical protein K2N05_09180 [Muribaculaceae bacterium]|nr:hypothetical protein [Muribaculaceae bacterium]
MAKHHIHRVARTFEEVFNNADQFSDTCQTLNQGVWEYPTSRQKEEKRTVKSFICEHRPKRKVHIQQDPSEVSEGSNELAIEALWWRPRLRSRKRGGITATPI